LPSEPTHWLLLPFADGLRVAKRICPRKVFVGADPVSGSIRYQAE
jgi:hypothetical protein